MTHMFQNIILKINKAVKKQQPKRDLLRLLSPLLIELAFYDFLYPAFGALDIS